MRPFQMPTMIECNIDTLTDKYGEFVAQPLERGWGITLGNALRRILLSSIEGAAIAAIRVDGVPHEFLRLRREEDVTDVVLNPKTIQFILPRTSPSPAPFGQGGPPSERGTSARYRAHPLPDAHIATLNERAPRDGPLQKGRGYPAEREKLPPPSSPWTPSSPVRKVNPEVTETRVGDAMDYERPVRDLDQRRCHRRTRSPAPPGLEHLNLFRASPPEAAVRPRALRPGWRPISNACSPGPSRVGTPRSRRWKRWKWNSARPRPPDGQDLQTTKNFGQKSQEVSEPGTAQLTRRNVRTASHAP